MILTQLLGLWLSTQTWFCFLLVAPSKRPRSSQIVRQHGSFGVGRQYQLLGKRVVRTDLLAINIYVPHRFVGAVLIGVPDSQVSNELFESFQASARRQS